VCVVTSHKQVRLTGRFISSAISTSSCGAHLLRCLISLPILASVKWNHKGRELVYLRIYTSVSSSGNLHLSCVTSAPCPSVYRKNSVQPTSPLVVHQSVLSLSNVTGCVWIRGGGCQCQCQALRSSPSIIINLLRRCRLLFCSLLCLSREMPCPWSALLSLPRVSIWSACALLLPSGCFVLLLPVFSPSLFSIYISPHLFIIFYLVWSLPSPRFACVLVSGVF
jgi:hypothetical protein